MKSTDKEDLMSYRLSDLFKSNYRTESQLERQTQKTWGWVMLILIHLTLKTRVGQSQSNHFYYHQMGSSNNRIPNNKEGQKLLILRSLSQNSTLIEPLLKIVLIQCLVAYFQSSTLHQHKLNIPNTILYIIRYRYISSVLLEQYLYKLTKLS